MECYFAQKINNNQLILNQEDTNHIFRVLKHRIGDEVVVIFQEVKYLSKIITLTPIVVCQIIKIIEKNSEIKVKVTLIMALLKEQKFDYIIQKAVELGVYQIVPVQLNRSVSVINNQEKMVKKVARWQKIARGAAMQSNRNIVPQILPVVNNLQDLIQYKSDSNFVAYENDTLQTNWFNNISNPHGSSISISIIIGPEGGISETEIKQLATIGFESISLGSTILRAETAPLYFLSVINYFDTFINK